MGTVDVICLVFFCLKTSANSPEKYAHNISHVHICFIMSRFVRVAVDDKSNDNKSVDGNMRNIYLLEWMCTQVFRE